MHWMNGVQEKERSTSVKTRTSKNAAAAQSFSPKMSITMMQEYLAHEKACRLANTLNPSNPVTVKGKQTLMTSHARTKQGVGQRRNNKRIQPKIEHDILKSRCSVDSQRSGLSRAEAIANPFQGKHLQETHNHLKRPTILSQNTLHLKPDLSHDTPEVAHKGCDTAGDHRAESPKFERADAVQRSPEGVEQRSAENGSGNLGRRSTYPHLHSGRSATLSPETAGEKSSCLVADVLPVDVSSCKALKTEVDDKAVDVIGAAQAPSVIVAGKSVEPSHLILESGPRKFILDGRLEASVSVGAADRDTSYLAEQSVCVKSLPHNTNARKKRVPRQSKVPKQKAIASSHDLFGHEVTAVGTSATLASQEAHLVNLPESSLGSDHPSNQKAAAFTACSNVSKTFVNTVLTEKGANTIPANSFRKAKRARNRKKGMASNQPNSPVGADPKPTVTENSESVQQTAFTLPSVSEDPHNDKLVEITQTQTESVPSKRAARSPRAQIEALLRTMSTQDQETSLRGKRRGNLRGGRATGRPRGQLSSLDTHQEGSRARPYNTAQGTSRQRGFQHPISALVNPKVQLVTMDASRPEADPVQIECLTTETGQGQGAANGHTTIRSMLNTNTVSFVPATAKPIQNMFTHQTEAPKDHFPASSDIRAMASTNPQLLQQSKASQRDTDNAEGPRQQFSPLKPEFDENGNYIPPHLRKPKASLKRDHRENGDHIPPHLKRSDPLDTNVESASPALLKQEPGSVKGSVWKGKEVIRVTPEVPVGIATGSRGRGENGPAEVVGTAFDSRPQTPAKYTILKNPNVPTSPPYEPGPSKQPEPGRLSPLVKSSEQPEKQNSSHDSNEWDNKRVIGSNDTDAPGSDGWPRELEADDDDEHHLQDWDGKWMPAPVEWDARPAFNNTGAKFAATVDQWIEERAAEAVIEVDVRDGGFQEGLAIATGTDKAYELIPELEQGATKLYPEDDYTPTMLNQTSHSSSMALIARTDHEQKDRKLDRKANRTAKNAHHETYVAPPNQHIPKANIYVRPANVGDINQIKDIYAWYISNSVVATEREQLDHAAWRGRLQDVEDCKLPFLVAVTKANRNNRRNNNVAEKIVGFGFADLFAGQFDAFKYAVEMQVFVHNSHKRVGVGMTLVDRILAALDPLYMSRNGTEFFANNALDYEQGGRKIVGRILITIPYIANNDKDFQWQKKWLAQWDFEHVATVPKLGYKFDKFINLAYLLKETGVTIGPGCGM
ncbi:MAG: hypothetical protein M1830_001600 [Pleopsidium flavum]|nr:MAG: hypothetical protein M1830_001600 [Pleopsidium flavum]